MAAQRDGSSCAPSMEILHLVRNHSCHTHSLTRALLLTALSSEVERGPVTRRWSKGEAAEVGRAEQSVLVQATKIWRYLGNIASESDLLQSVVPFWESDSPNGRLCVRKV